MHNHRRLHVWTRAHALAGEVYRHLARTRRHRDNAVADQLRRTVAAVPAHIAAGAGQPTDAEFAESLVHALRGCRDVERHLALAVAIGLVTSPQYERWVLELGQVARMLSALQRRLRIAPAQRG